MSHRTSGRLPTAAAVTAVLYGCAAPTPELGGLDPTAIDYNWHVRPILSENCFKCHGPDPAARKAGLRLDLREVAVGELPETPGKHAIVPGNASRSELVRRIHATDVDERMPPESTHKTLSAQQTAILEQWIENGAEYRPHWAFIAPQRPAVPSVADAADARNEIDRFVRARLAREGLSAAPEADKETLINRVTLTLTGLPPTLDDVDAFAADTAPDAYERLVDRLLASSAYAEHMADYWLDLARFSETDGFLDDHHDRLLWPWRDWVIDSFARNRPFDEFGTWQLAGDLLPNATREQVLATAYLRVGKRTTENGAIDAEYKAEYMVERTDNALGVAFLGLTVGCARCHDHKYDPITQADYYSLGAFFNSTDEPGAYAPGFSGIQGGPTLPWPDEATAAALGEAEADVAARSSDYAAAHTAARSAARTEAERLAADAEKAAAVVRGTLAGALAAHYELESARPAALTDLPPPRPPRIPPPSLTEFRRNAYSAPPAANETAEQRRQREAAALAARVPRNYNAESLTLSPAATPGVAAAVVQSPLFGAGVKGQALYFDETNRGFFGRDVGYYDRQDPFTLDFWFYVAAAYDDVPVLNHLAEQNSGRTGYRLTIRDGKLWASLAHSPPANMIAIETVERLPVGEWSHITLAYDGSSRAAGLRLFLNGAPAATRVERDQLTRTILPFTSADVFDPFLGLAFGTRFREKAPVGSAIDELRVFKRDLTPVEIGFLHDEARAVSVDALADLLAATDARVVAARTALTDARARENGLATSVPQVLVMGEAPEPTPTYVLKRGVYSDPGERVDPQGLTSVLAWDERWPRNRLGLARWLFDAKQPLTARVLVNRIWQMHFGRGLVETSEDFGSQGAIPTHPELLDWLAVELVESGWDVKALHRLIVTSATYRQSSAATAELIARDAANALYARGPRWRMTAEMVRDGALAASGLLVRTVGGRSVKPYQPAGIWNPLNSFYDYPVPDSLPADDLHRRTLYTFVKRNATHPGLKIFDFTSRTESVARRRSSNTPLQALELMNDPQYVEAYRALAAEALRISADEDAQLERLYRLATRATPRPEHIALLRDYYRAQRAAYDGNDEKIAGALDVGVVPGDPALDRTALAALTNVAALVMNSPDAYTGRLRLAMYVLNGRPIDRSRRDFLLKSAGGLGWLSLLDLFGAQAQSAAGAASAGLLGTGQIPARAKRVICLHMLGAISHVDTFDYKPTLMRMHGQDLPPSVRETQRLSTMSNGQSAFPIVGPLRPFKQRGESGAWVSDFLPYTGSIADELCFVRSLHTEHVNHDPASKFLHTGFQLAGRPSAGAWVSYALGSDNRDLPSFVVMNSGVSQGVPQDAAIWGSGFLPSHHQGIEFRAAEDPVLYVNNPAGIDRNDRRALLDSLAKLAALQHEESNDPEILSRVSQYEMAYRMQRSVPEVADISAEPKSVLEMYGPDVTKPGTFARNCLIARRLAERGVKYQTIFHLGWDLHLAIKINMPLRCAEIDRPAAALVMDLKQRGLLDDTLVMFGSEFGRTPFAQGQIDNPLVGRDHHGGCFTWWFAGGGVKAGYTHGETDEFSYNIVKDPVHIHDLNATLLHILGLDHERVTFRFQGRDYRLTDVHGKVVHEILA